MQKIGRACAQLRKSGPKFEGAMPSSGMTPAPLPAELDPLVQVLALVPIAYCSARSTPFSSSQGRYWMRPRRLLASVTLSDSHAR